MPSRPRFVDFRASGGPQALGECATDINAVMGIVNESQERLINDPLAPDDGWWGSWARMEFTVSRSSPTIVTPQEVARIILMDVCKHPVRINNSFYEYLEFGRGFQPSFCTQAAQPCQNLMAYERETVTTFEPLASTPQIIRAYVTNPNDVGRSCLVQGKDANGATIYNIAPETGFAGQGETVVFQSPFSDTLNQFSTITGMQKQKTFGEVEFFQVDPNTLVESPLLVMSPGETTALYRKYYVNGLPNNCCNSQCTTSSNLQVLALCKLDFVPVQCDSDYLRIMSVPALIDECMSVRYGRIDSVVAQNLSAQKHASALKLLFGQLDNYLGRERPAIGRAIFGSNRLRPSFQ